MNEIDQSDSILDRVCIAMPCNIDIVRGIDGKLVTDECPR